MWKPTTRDQSMSLLATSPARNSFWLGAAAKTTLARPAASCRSPDGLADGLSRGPSGRSRDPRRPEPGANRPRIAQSTGLGTAHGEIPCVALGRS